MMLKSFKQLSSTSNFLVVALKNCKELISLDLSSFKHFAVNAVYVVPDVLKL